MWDDLEVIKDRASSCVGLCIALGNRLEDGYKEIQEEFAPVVEKVLPRVQPRVITGYATLLWFTSKVLFNYTSAWVDCIINSNTMIMQLLQESGLSDLAEDVVRHFTEKQAPTICLLQQAQPNQRSSSDVRASHLDVIVTCIKKVIDITQEIPDKTEVSIDY